MRNFKNNKGITLIALAVTVVVLLILSGIAITQITDDNGIIRKAFEAKDAQESDEQREQDILNQIREEANSGSIGVGDEPKQKIPLAWKESVDELTQDGIPVPKDFDYVDGEKDTGIIIKDANNNEFVWVPVDDMADFKRDNFGRSHTLAEVSTTNAYWDDKTTTEYQNMVASVETYGGFYIARYEASFGGGTAVANYKPLSKPSTSNSTSSMSYTQGRLWNFVSQLDAITVCSNMYGSEASVVSHLPWGIEWDTMLAWLRDTAFKNEANPNSLIAGNSTSWGNYYNVSFKYGPSETQKNTNSQVLINTGEITNPENRHMKNNIYDITGNLRQWTQEKYNTARVYRGSHSYNGGVNDPAAFRHYDSESFSNDVVGFRPVIYIK